MERPLSPMERMLFEVDRVYPLNFTTVAHLRGPLTEAAVAQAVSALVARHPHLGHRIVAEANGVPWLRDGGAPPTVRWVQGSEWIVEADREVNEPLPMETGPLIRLVVIEHGPDQHTVLLTFHHCVGDGFSGAFLARDLVQALSGAALTRLPDAGSLDALIPPTHRGWVSLRRQLSFLLRELWRTLRWGVARTIRDRPGVLAFDRRARVVSHVLPPAVSDRLTERARREKTTVHGALSAALTLAAAHDTGAGKPIRVGFGSPVNLRKQLEPNVGEDLGLYVSMAAWAGMVAADQPLWELARDMKAALVADQAKGFQFAAMQLAVRAAQFIGAGRVAPRLLAQRMERLIPATAGLTNLGRLDLVTQFGELEIERLHFLTSPSALGAWVSTATSLNGHLVWNFTFCEPAISEARARALADDCVRRVMQAIEAPALGAAAAADSPMPTRAAG